MWHALGIDEKDFFRGLVETDEQLAAAEQARGCQCGGRLDRADYPRKTRGVPAEWDHLFEQRLSFCCAREGCRRRCTPPSVRFFGRRAYAGAVILLVSAGWVSARPAHVPTRTANRWHRFFVGRFRQTVFWRAARAMLMPPVTEAELPASLLERFAGGRGNQLHQALGFLAPTTTKSSGVSMLG